MMVQCDRLHCPLLRILKITVHAVLLRVTSDSVHEFRILVLLIPIYLTVRYLVHTIVSLLFSFVINFTFVHVVKVFLPIGLLFIIVFFYDFLFALVF